MKTTRQLLRFLPALAVTVPTAFAAAGSVTGKVVYEGDVPKSSFTSATAECGTRNRLLLGGAKEVANVLVRVVNPPAAASTSKLAAKSVALRKGSCSFGPLVTGAVVGQPVSFKNSDGILHAVHGTPAVNVGFNVGMPPTVKEKSTSFEKPEPPFKVECKEHPGAIGYVAVMTHPYHGVSDQYGRYSIPSLPTGRYQIELWHELLGTRTRYITVGSEDTKIDLIIKAPPSSD